MLDLAAQPAQCVYVEGVPCPSAGQLQQLLNVSGPGVVTAIHTSQEGGSFPTDGRLRVFVDGEQNPSIDVDMGVLWCTALQNNQGPTWCRHVNSQPMGAARPTAYTGSLLFPIPFASGCRIEVYNPGVQGGGQFFSQTYWHPGQPDASLVSLRLRSLSVPLLNAQTMHSGQPYQFFDIQGKAGWLAWTSFACRGLSDNSYLERHIKFTIDGNPGYETEGFEDYFLSGWYFTGRPSGSWPWAMCAVNAGNVLVAGLDLLEMCGGLKFTSELKMESVLSAYKAGYCHTDATVGWCALYYELTGPPPAPTAPSAPQNLTVTPGDGSGFATWSPPASNGNSPILGYTLTLTPGGQTSTAGTSLNLTGLANGTQYTASVHATNAVGNSPESNQVTFTPAVPPPPTIPTAPLSFAVTNGNASGSATWNPPASDGGSPFTGYAVTVNPGGLTYSGNSPLNLTNLVNGTTYLASVHATNAVGNGPESNSASFTPVAAAQIIDDGDSSGIAFAGGWQLFSNQGYKSTVHENTSLGGSNAVATWTFAVQPGTYQVAVTWSPYTNRATNADFTVKDGSNVLGTVLVNQQLTPGDFQDQGVGWKVLGTYTIKGTSLVVQLSDSANGYVIADAVRIA